MIPPPCRVMMSISRLDLALDQAGNNRHSARSKVDVCIYICVTHKITDIILILLKDCRWTEMLRNGGGQHIHRT